MLVYSDQHKAETAIVRHIDGYSSYDTILTLDLMLKYDRVSGKYQDKIVRYHSYLDQIFIRDSH